LENGGRRPTTTPGSTRRNDMINGSRSNTLTREIRYYSLFLHSFAWSWEV
jgi:hypothetical protein